MLKSELIEIDNKKQRLSEIENSLIEIKEMLSEEDGEFDVLNNDNSKFVKTEVNKKLVEYRSDIELPEKILFEKYLTLNRNEKLDFVQEHDEINWDQMTLGKNGYTKGELNKYLNHLLNSFDFPEGTFAAKLAEVSRLMEEQAELTKQIKSDEETLHNQTKETIESLSVDESLNLLDIKWNQPIVESINGLLPNAISDIISEIDTLNNKYIDTLISIETDLKAANNKMKPLLDGFKGNKDALQALEELKGVLD